MRYIPQLDGLRAIAVILVIISHWLPETHFLNILPNGMMGVQLFFVLSGYLITKGLLKDRGAKDAVRNFYIKRTLRIFPIYYLSLFVLYIFRHYISHVSGVDIANSLLYHLTYTSNFYFAGQGGWWPIISHLWSLSVEEQFYLIWPWLILFVPKKYLLHTVIVFIAIGVASTLLISGFSRFVLTPCHFFALGLGGLLAWFETYRNTNRAFTNTLNIISLFALAIFAYSFINPFSSAIVLCFDVLALWIIHFAINTPGFLNFKPLVFLWKISYGLYLYHLFIPALVTDHFILKRMPHSITEHWSYISPVLSGVILLIVAWGSYVIIEKPLLSLKKRFTSRPQQAKRVIELS